MCQIVSTDTLHWELIDFFEEAEPLRLVNPSYVKQFEPWLDDSERDEPQEFWTEEDLELLRHPSSQPSHMQVA